MDNLLLINSKISLSHISDNSECFLLTQLALFLYMLLQIPSLTILSHDIHIVFSHKDLNCFEDMRMG